jgi:serralysin
VHFARISSGILLMGVSLAATAGPERTVNGDFNGDGRRDIALLIDDGGMATIDIYTANGYPNADSFTTGQWRWATRQGNFWKAQKWSAGDFNGDGKDDLAKVFDCGNGQACIDVHLSNGSSFYTMQRWATNQGGYWNAQQWLVGDFNGDGRADLAKAFNEGGYGSVDVHLSTGSGFIIQRFATRQGRFWDGQKWLAGDFNGDGFTDVAKAFGDGGKSSIDVHLSNGSSFSMQRWATQQGGFWDAQWWLVGDFDGDGRDDAVLTFANSSGYADFAIHRSTGSGFAAVTEWPNLKLNFPSSNSTVTLEAGDFTGDGLADMADWSGSGTTPRLRRNIGGGFYVAPVTCTTQNVAKYEGWVQCGFASGIGDGTFYEYKSSSPWAVPRNLYNEFTGYVEVCSPFTQTPFVGYELETVCK